MRSIELFTGAGGLALGTSLAGFEHAAVVEFDHDCCETLRLNQRLGRDHVRGWRIIEGDVRQLNLAEIGPVEMIAGGVPCQPFSLGGKHRAYEDTRDMFPEFARVIAMMRPKAFVVENVKGLLRGTFADYFEYVLLRLAHPLVAMKVGQTWREHRAELECVQSSGMATGLEYNVLFQLLNAADYGIPQRRERVFIVGFRSDLAVRWSFPGPNSLQSRLAPATTRFQRLLGPTRDPHPAEAGFDGLDLGSNTDFLERGRSLALENGPGRHRRSPQVADRWA